MATLNTLQIKWDTSGHVQWWTRRSVRLDDSDVFYSLGGIALTDHMLSTLKSENVLNFCEQVLRGLVKNKLTIKPINSELKSATLNFNTGKALYTIFKGNVKMFSDNQKTEQALSQMVQNYIGKLLATNSDENKLAVKSGIYSMIVFYESQIRLMHETDQSVKATRANLYKAASLVLQNYPYDSTPENVENLMSEVERLIEKFRELPLTKNRGLFYK